MILAVVVVVLFFALIVYLCIMPNAYEKNRKTMDEIDHSKNPFRKENENPKRISKTEKRYGYHGGGAMKLRTDTKEKNPFLKENESSK